MKILLCTTRMDIGGAETHVLTLARELQKQGHGVVVLSSGGLLASELEKSGIRHILLPFHKSTPRALCKCRAGLCKTVNEFRPDIIHAHGRIPAFVCGSLRKKTGFPPTVTTVHGMYDPSQPKKMFSYWGEKTIAVSGDVKDYLCSEYRLPEVKITVIPNGVSLCETAWIFHSGINLLMCSRLDRDSVQPVLDIIGLIPELRRKYPEKNITLTVIGGGDAAKDAKYAAESRNGTKDCIFIEGKTADIAPYLARADIFIGCSRSLIEALAAGVPSVMLSPTASGSICDGLVTADNIQGLSEKNFLSKASANCQKNRIAAPCPGLFDSICECICSLESGSAANSEGCRQFIAAHHSIESVANQTLDFYKDVINSRKKGIMLCGYFGAGNAGDDATLSSVCSLLREKEPGAKIYVTVSSDKYKDSLPAGVIPVKKRNILGVRRGLKSCNRFILCGGTLLQNSTSSRSLAYYCALAGAAVKLGCKAEILGGGIGPVKGKTAEKTVKRLLTRLDSAGFRDKSSYEYACALCSDGQRENNYNGPGFYLSEDPVLWGNYTENTSITLPENSVLITPRDVSKFYGKKAERNYEGLLIALSSKLIGAGITPVFLPMSSDDVKLCRRLFTACPGSVFTGTVPYNQLPSIARQCKCVLAVRLHGAVFAHIAGTPCICLSYDPKVRAFAESNGLKTYDFDGLPAAEELFDLIVKTSAL